MVRLLLAVILVLGILGWFAVAQSYPPNTKVSASANKQNQHGRISSKGCSCCNGRDGRDGQNGRDGRDGRDGIQGVKGEKGEQCFKRFDEKDATKDPKGEHGSPRKSPSVIKFSDTSENCTISIAGTVRYNTARKVLQLCDGSAWLTMLTAGEDVRKKGFSADKPGRHCLDILNSGQSRGSWFYWIDPNGGSTDDSFQAFCDMETERGGWTLVAAKVSPGFSFIKSAFSTVAAKTKNADAASHIHPSMGDWGEVMFRFADVSTIRVIYNRKAGAPQKDKEEFDEFLMGKSMAVVKNVYGFYKYSPSDRKRSPTGGFSTISRLHIYTTAGISEQHTGSDKWLDMWNSADGSNNYIYTDDRRAVGTKCIAGYCYLNKPIWVMVR